MYDDTVQLMVEGGSHLIGIALDGIERDIDVAIHARARGIIKGDDVGEIVVLEKLAVDSEDLLIVAKDIVEFAYGELVIRCYGTNPSLYLGEVERRHGDIVVVESDHVRILLKTKIIQN